jgi:hypothetical protein
VPSTRNIQARRVGASSELVGVDEFVRDDVVLHAFSDRLVTILTGKTLDSAVMTTWAEMYH